MVAKKKKLFMNSKNFSILIAFASVLSLGAKDFSESELLEIGRDALRQRAAIIDLERQKIVFRNSLQELSDAQRIKAVFYGALESENIPKFRMSNYSSVLTFLNRDTEWVRDWSSLRRMLIEEKDPRKFYILSKMVPFSTADQKFDFVAERAHMLFADGRVSKYEGEYTPPYAADVSKYAYTVINGNLRALGAGFDSPSKKLPHKEQVAILVKWLKENWPGCENLDVTEKVSAGDERTAKSLNPTSRSPLRKKENKSTVSKSKLIQTENSQKESSWLLIVGGGLFVGCLAHLFRAWKARFIP